jgi:uncharacterized protein with von Willebrand factor type A (vWA) domain
MQRQPTEGPPPAGGNGHAAPGGHLLHNLVLFGRVLRGVGLDVNPGRMIDLVDALGHIDLGRRADFYFACRGLLVHRREDLALFDEAFRQFWRPPAEGWLVDLPAYAGKRRTNRVRVIPPALQRRDPPAGGQEGAPDPNAPPVLEVTRTYSAQEVLRHKDFSELTASEYEAVKAMIAGLTWRLGERRTRRQQPGRGPRLDLRRTLRRNLKHGGQVLHWSYREPRFKPRPLVLLADISGSMERYTRLLLHFVYSLATGLSQPVEAFVFSTRLTRITRQLEQKEIETALRDVGQAVSDWAGGTRMGEALKDFNFRWGRRVLGRGAVALVISDGWDRGDPDLLRREMARLQRNCYRLIWLNPLLGSANYEPLTRGMQAALPHVDDFLPVHNLASLEDLARHLATLDPRRRR